MLIRHPLHFPPDTRVAALLVPDRGWNVDLIKEEFCSLDSESILGVKLHEGESDSWLWDFRWRSKAPPRVITFAWRCAFNALPVGTRLQKRGVRLDDGCSSCGHPDEDVLHVLFRCSLARLVWAIPGLAWGTIECSRTSVEEWFREVSSATI
ncbi:UNVERIFIED_CONTAM: hypothetical protein Slati_1734400 [Sesamum latifolium]|uniref:Reverse transcriptase zinc-binding domain-containing protein n=1 Tax=Sesamum latifolium TaxID=2727402 RepID=A0AAW2WWK4_9LAMI